MPRLPELITLIGDHFAKAAFCAPGSHPATTVCAQNPWIRSRMTVETDSPERGREAMRRLAEKKVDAVKIVHQGGCKHGSPYFFKAEALGINVQILKLEKAVLEAVIDETHRHGLKATVHTVDADAAIEALFVLLVNFHLQPEFRSLLNVGRVVVFG
jgi:hypothetical protein